MVKPVKLEISYHERNPQKALIRCFPTANLIESYNYQLVDTLKRS